MAKRGSKDRKTKYIEVDPGETIDCGDEQYIVVLSKGEFIDKDEYKKLKVENENLKAEYKKIKSELNTWTTSPQRLNRYLKWRDRDTLEWKTYEYSNEFLLYRKNIDDYFTGKFDKNGQMIFNYPNDKEELMPPELYDRLKDELSESEAERLYNKLSEIEKKVGDKKQISIVETIKRNHPLIIDFEPIEKTIEYLFQHKNEWNLTSNIRQYVGLKRGMAHYYLNILLKNNIVKRKKIDKAVGWCLKSPYGN